MASIRKIYNLYKLNQKQYLLTRVSRPGYSNVNQAQKNEAERIYDLKQKGLLNVYLCESNHINNNHLELIGVFEGLPEGDILYNKHGAKSINNIRYARIHNTSHIYITIAKSDVEFWKQTNEDDFADIGITRKNLTLPVQNINEVFFITENDYDLSTIPDFDTEDLEDKS